MRVGEPVDAAGRRTCGRASCCPAASRCTATCSARATAGQLDESRPRQNETSGGRSDTEVNEVAVKPAGGGRLRRTAVTTVTVLAWRRSSAGTDVRRRRRSVVTVAPLGSPCRHATSTWLRCGGRPAGRPGQAVVLAQRAAGVLGAEQAAPLQHRHDLVDEVRQPAGQVRRHDVEAVGGAVR